MGKKFTWSKENEKILISIRDDKAQSPHNVQEAPEYHVRLEKPHHKHKTIRKCRTEPFKHKGKKECMSRDMKNALIKNYMAVVKQSSNKKLSNQTILRETRKLWLQQYPPSSISLQSINRIVSSENRVGSMHDGSVLTVCNVPNCTARLKTFRQASIDLASQPIYNYICYNCGRLLPYDWRNKHTHFITFDPASYGLTHPPILDLFDCIGDFIYGQKRQVGVLQKLQRCPN